jgi:hypothetical protein
MDEVGGHKLFQRQMRPTEVISSDVANMN